MQISLLQLETVISKVKYGLIGYGSDKKDIVITIEFTQADPGTGQLVDVLTIKGVAPQKEGDTKETSMIAEIYPDSERRDPRGSKIESFKITERF